MQQLYTRLIIQDKAEFLFAPYSSGLTATAAVISEQYGKIMIITGGAEEKTYTLGNKYLFQVITPAGHYLERRGRGAAQQEPEGAPRLRLFRRSVLEGGGPGGARPG